jgi:hypothetical protein
MRNVLSACAITVFLVSHAVGADPDAAIRTTFVDPWVSAVRAKDLAKVKSLFHPKVLACINEQTRDYFDDSFAHIVRDSVAGSYKITKLEPLKGPLPAFLPADSFALPVQPTYEVQVQSGDLVWALFLAESNGSWYDVGYCPNEKGMAFFHQQIAEGAAQRKRAEQLAAEMKDPLLAELRGLLARQQLIGAIHRYQQAAGVDLTTAKLVIDVLQRKQ